MVPAAATVAFSRVYDGVHYPSDVAVGAILGAGYAAATVWSADALWRWAGQKWFPLWWRHLPSLMCPDEKAPDQARAPDPAAEADRQWLRLGYVLIGVIFLSRLAYLASGKIDLSKDEAYQWLWSKHLALSYYSKPLMIALAQWLGTHLWGDTAFGVRFLSPVAAAVVSLLLLRFLAREVNARAGVALILVTSVAPLMVLGSTILTIDPLLIAFWTAAMVTGWRAMQPDSTTRHWLWTGLWAGLGFLSKYSALFLWVCWALFFVLWKPARAQWRRPGPWLALGVNLLCTAPVLIWNAQNQWVTVAHVGSNAAAGRGWEFDLMNTLDLVLVTAGLTHPIFFVAAAWAAVFFWIHLRGQPLPLYLFCMGTPVFLLHLVYTLHSGILPNWIAPSVLPSFCLMTLYWDRRWRDGKAPALGRWLAAGLITGGIMVAFGLFPDLTRKIAGYTLPPRMDPLRRIQGWRRAADTVEAQRRKLAAEGRPTFILCDHYGITGLFAFYIPEARRDPRHDPLVYVIQHEPPRNQLYFWPRYRFERFRAGHNAILVAERDEARPAPPQAAAFFESVTDLGIFPLEHGGRVTRRLQMWECRNLKADSDRGPLP